MKNHFITIIPIIGLIYAIVKHPEILMFKFYWQYQFICIFVSILILIQW